MSNKYGEPSFFEYAMAFLGVCVLILAVSQLVKDVFLVDNGSYYFKKIEKIKKVADEVRGQENTTLNEKTISKLKENFYNDINNSEEMEKSNFEVINNKFKLSGVVSYSYYGKMFNYYEDQLTGVFKNFYFDSNCKKEKLESCFVEIIEK